MILDAIILIVVLIFTGVGLYAKRSRGAIFFLTLFSLLYFGFIREGCLCPVGSLQNVVDSIFSGKMPVGMVAVLFLIPLLVASFAGRLFCGAACPLGAIQDLISLDKIKIPRFVDRTMVLLPPVLFYLILIAMIRGDGYLLCRFDPFIPLFRFNGSLIAIIISAIFLLITLFISRPFCRYICPYAPLLGLFSLFSKWRVEIEPAKSCISCTLCVPACPVDVIREGKVEKAFNLKLFLLSSLLIIVAGSFLGGVIAIIPRWFFEPESFELTSLLSDKLLITGRVVGAISAIFWIIELKSRMTPAPVGFTPLHHRCVSCGRCYNSCPGELKRLREEEA
jgi:NosR/NirI family nitrous oxide reductase transcriptional regulator